MALTRSFQFSHMLGGGSTPLIQVAEGASQTFKEAEIIINTSGYAVVGAADATAGTIIGLSANAGHNTTAGLYDVGIIPAIPGICVFEGQIQNAAGTATIAQATHMFVTFSINVTANKWWVDTDDTSHLLVTVIGFKDAVGTLNGVVYFVFSPLATAWGRVDA